ncbi:hypothetical protein DFJ58DRAFT_846192 [Suillus subalutaceus]|uniref:uncharacterized protein n=1 Tax=Suillus subalutaceus TaxID=48586 RepID=UPI001B8677C7|nr:uncharacterized protein DFJ58DRAFT_846192 [Suillus subalutaceus]KAG1838157.1 hypothetical protein DFJ58DRAFT_846192 [Suillus subalutaceus]
MEAPSSPSSTITAPPDCRETARRLAKLIVEATFCDYALLHYDSASKSMVEWWWPIDGDGKKILPFNLEIHHKEYELKYPCCLCADGRGRTAYIECAVYSWRNKDTGQFDWTASILEERVLPIKLQWNRREQRELLNRLDSCVGNGITTREFHILFSHCRRCKRVGEYEMRDTIEIRKRQVKPLACCA